MRYFFAILTLVVAAVLLILGVGQRTFLSGPNSVQFGVDAGDLPNGLAVIPGPIFNELRGQPSVILSGESVFLATATDRDIEGWLAGQEYAELSLNDASDALIATMVSGSNDASESGDGDEEEAEEEPRLDPRGSDLWLSEFVGESTLKVATNLDPNQSVLVTVSSENEGEGGVQISWAREKHTPLAGPLLVTGALFAALGAILYLTALDHDRRGLGPRRGRRGPFQGLRNRRIRAKRTESTTRGDMRPRTRMGLQMSALAGGLVLVLSGCSPSYWPQPVEPSPTIEATEAPEESRAPVPVSDGQIDLITSRISDVVNAADNELDADLLAERFSGPALNQRAANYKIRSEESSYQTPPRLTDERLDYTLVQSTENWPRTMFLTVESSLTDPDATPEEADETTESDDSTGDEAEGTDEEAPETTPTLALIATQESAHENYLVHHAISLRGGIEMPAAAPISEGTALLADDLKTLRLEPRLVGEAFADVLQEGTESDWYDHFAVEDEILTEKMGAAWASQQSGENVTYSASVTPSDVPVVTLSTGQSGALVVTSIFDDHITTSDGERYRVELSKIEQALGLSGSQERVIQRWQHDILFYVPSAESGEQIVVLGSASEIVSASN